ncbi:MAG: hypothetical protein V5A39_02300 [Haloarculaceae archaeon]
MSGQTTRRGQSDLVRLALFVLAVFLVVLVTPFVLQFAGIDVRGPQDEGAGESAQLTVLGTEGGAIDGERASVGEVRVVVTNTGGGEVDPADLSVTWVGNGSYDLVAAGTDRDADGTFTVRPLDESRDDAVLRDHGDRAVLTFDLGDDDVAGADEFGSRLRAGETATVSLTSPGGATVTTGLFAPDPLPDGDGITL